MFLAFMDVFRSVFNRDISSIVWMCQDNLWRTLSSYIPSLREALAYLGYTESLDVTRHGSMAVLMLIKDRRTDIVHSVSIRHHAAEQQRVCPAEQSQILTRHAMRPC